MTDVLLGQSYYLRFDPKLWATMQPYPPLGTMYAASYLRKLGFDVALFDAMLASSESEWVHAIERFRPCLAVIYEDNFNYLSKMCLLRMRRAAFTMIDMARARNCTVVVAGSDPSDHCADYLARGAHYVIHGEGEQTLGELVRGLCGRDDRSVDEIAGLAFARDGKVVRTPSRPDLRDLDSLPFPAWDLVDVDHYSRVWRRRHGYYSMNVATSRGCPYHCNWCAKPIWGQRYNVRSPESVVAELDWLKHVYRPDHIWFVDDIMGLRPGWIERFATLVQEADTRIPFKSLNRADLLLKGDTVAALRRAGARTVWLGAESGSQRILDAMEKGTRVEQIAEATRRLHANGIEVGFFLQFGYLGEGLDDVEQTIQLVRDCAPDDIGISVSYPLPGTKFYRDVQEQLGKRRHWHDSDDLAMLYHGPFNTLFYRKLHQVVHLEFRARKLWNDLRGRSIDGRRRRPSLRRVLGGLLNLVSLPMARWQLARLAQSRAEGIEPLTPALSPDDAARPSAQPEPVDRVTRS
jgi:anaerobic magnesium-protoporphyrin IX monomethyl ester cyclase